ncbi:hypothetical protein Runsl_4566 [Runella slithyformis DSM 19594]|uniref:ECF transporter S component n=2 Tax=Runella TaxID=105 RepID=A0A7U3ZPB2_RUNSL|nr:hypothetical protein Runsl_4566 [Runella slithyformis DSM 19594]
MNLGLSRFSTVVILIIVAALSRVVPHPFNFTPIGAMALFGAAQFNRKIFAFMIPVVAMLLSDALIGNPSFPTYFSFALIAGFGVVYLKKLNAGRLLTASIAASVVFFIITNFFVWFGGTMYPQTWQGLIGCYTAGLAFYQQTFFGNLFLNTVMGDLFYNTLLFGAYYSIEKIAFKPTVA